MYKQLLTGVSSRPEAACGSISTVYTTLPGSSITETSTLTVTARKPQSLSINAAGVSFTSSDATATDTNYLTSTDVISIDESSSTSAVADQGPFFFNIDNGITSWYSGKKPPSTASFVTSTAIITLVPVPESSSVSVDVPEPSTSDIPTSTSYITTLLTTKVSKMHTETLTESLSPSVVSTSTKLFSGFGSSGWNATYATLKTIKVTEEGSRVVKSDYPKTDLRDDKHLLLPGSARTPPASSPSIKYNHARDVGATVHATINGAVVSWTNSYQGTSTPKSAVASSPAVPMVSISLVLSSKHFEPSVGQSGINGLLVVSSLAVPIYPSQLTPSAPVESTAASSGTLTSGETSETMRLV